MIVSVLATASAPADALDGQPTPTLADTGRLLGYLWGDAVLEDGVWNMDRASGTQELFQTLVIRHGGTWVEQRQLRFTLPAPYDWDGWYSSVPNDDARTRAAVRHPNFLAAVLEGEGEVDGRIYDQKSCCRPYVEARLISLQELLVERGFETASITKFGDVDSGAISIAPSEFAELRRTHQFACPLSADSVRVPGGEDYESYGPIRWFSTAGDYSELVRTNCESGQRVTDSTTPVGDCVVTSDGDGSLRVSWSYKHGNIAVRRDNKFLAESYAIERFVVDTPPTGEHRYDLRITIDGLRFDESCGTGDTRDSFTPPPRGKTCFDETITHLGTGAADVIDGTPGVDVIHGFGGDDLLRGFGQNDIICGGDGNDRIRGGYGHDLIDGGGGHDRIDAGAGADDVNGGFGNDVIYGRRGPDLLRGGGGADVLRAGDGFDTLFGGRGVDILRGGNHRDACNGGWGLDVIAADCETVNQ